MWSVFYSSHITGMVNIIKQLPFQIKHKSNVNVDYVIL